MRESRSILLTYEMIPDGIQMFFIPDHKELNKKVLKAIQALRGLTVNSDELNDDQWARFEVFNAALTKPKAVKHLDKKWRKYAGLLLPYEVTDQKSLQVTGKLYLVRIGMVL